MVKLKFLGTTASIPDVHEECPCFLVNKRYLFDCGFDVLSALRETDCDLSEIDHVIFTHMHHDHYLGLATLLFYYIHSGTKNIKDLTILGPEKDVKRVVDLAYGYLQLDLFYSNIDRPRVIPLKDEDEYKTDDAVIKCTPALHPVDARSYKFISDGTSLAISGDTLYNEQALELFRGADAIIHEATLGYREGKGNNGHSTILEAIKIAELSGIDTLFPIHMSVEKARISVEKAKNGTNVNMIAPKRGVTYEIE